MTDSPTDPQPQPERPPDIGDTAPPDAPAPAPPAPDPLDELREHDAALAKAQRVAVEQLDELRADYDDLRARLDAVEQPADVDPNAVTVGDMWRTVYMPDGSQRLVGDVGNGFAAHPGALDDDTPTANAEPSHPMPDGARLAPVQVAG